MPISAKQRRFLDRVLQAMDAGQGAEPYALAEALGAPPQAIEAILQIGIDEGEIVRLDPRNALTVGQIARHAQTLGEAFGKQPFAVADARRALGVPRYLILPLLDYLDDSGITEYDGERRTLRSGGA